MNDTFYRAVTPVVEVLEDLRVAYYIGGSVASITYGMPRSTMDVDIVADMRPPHVTPIVRRLIATNYLDAEAIREAIARRSSFNIIPLQGPMKIDIFVPKGRPFDRSIFERVRYVSLEPEAPRPYALPTPEDIILLKLEWYELSHRASLHQWPDVLGVIQGQYDVLDRTYLRRWASLLGLAELLEQAFGEAGV